MTGRTLIVSEKPMAAERLARALDEAGRPAARRERGVPYFVASRDGRELVVVSALGHLYTVASKGGGWTYPVLEPVWVPAHRVERSASRTEAFIMVIKRLSEGVDGYVSACDFDVEGSLIAYNILLHVCGAEILERAGRMRFSTLTDGDIVEAWEKRSPSLDYPMIEAGRARHEVDWLFGINLSRALTLSVKNATGYYRTLSIGRVQGPTLNSVVERELEVRTHVPIPYWSIEAEMKVEGRRYGLEYERQNLESELEARGVEEACRGREGTVRSITSRKTSQPPPHPFSLGDLQREAYQQLRLAPRTTLAAAERLYLDALISYPRTSSQRLPPSIDLREIVAGLGRSEAYRPLSERLLSKGTLRPRNGWKVDPAHPAIHPTGRLPERLSQADRRLFDLVCRRFMATLGDPAVKLETVAEIDVDGHKFHSKGIRVLEPGWTLFYSPYAREREVPAPPLEEGRRVEVVRVDAAKMFTRPPPRFNPSSLLRLMEDEGIGTKATRTEVIDTLFKRGYVEGSPMGITDLGLAIVETLGRHCPEILSVEMTRRLEGELERIQTGELSAEAVVEGAVEALKPILAEFKAHERPIGLEINSALRSLQLRANLLGPCPICKKGELRLIRNRTTGKRFAGCSNYLGGACSATYPLPQLGRILPLRRPCASCGAPIIRVLRPRRRPWELCINLDCPSKKGRGRRGGEV